MRPFLQIIRMLWVSYTCRTEISKQIRLSFFPLMVHYNDLMTTCQNGHFLLPFIAILKGPDWFCPVKAVVGRLWIGTIIWTSITWSIPQNECNIHLLCFQKYFLRKQLVVAWVRVVMLVYFFLFSYQACRVFPAANENVNRKKNKIQMICENKYCGWGYLHNEWNHGKNETKWERKNRERNMLFPPASSFVEYYCSLFPFFKHTHEFSIIIVHEGFFMMEVIKRLLS